MNFRKKNNLFDIILNIIIILLTILVVYWFIQLIFGGSPGLSEINSALIILIGSFLIKIYRETGEIKTGIKYSFIKIREDINRIENKIDNLKK